jgi:hypothetical protein
VKFVLLGRPTFLLRLVNIEVPGLGILFLSILCKLFSHFCWYYSISLTRFYTASLSLTDWFVSRLNSEIPRRYLRNFICDTSIFLFLSSLFFSTQASLLNFKAALAVVPWIHNFVSSVICVPKCFRVMPFIFLYVSSFCYKSPL